MPPVINRMALRQNLLCAKGTRFYKAIMLIAKRTQYIHKYIYKYIHKYIHIYIYEIIYGINRHKIRLKICTYNKGSEGATSVTPTIPLPERTEKYSVLFNCKNVFEFSFSNLLLNTNLSHQNLSAFTSIYYMLIAVFGHLWKSLHFVFF